MNILIPIFEKTHIFVEEGFTLPKCMLPIEVVSEGQEAKTMVEGAIDSLGITGKLIFSLDFESEQIKTFLLKKFPTAHIIHSADEEKELGSSPVFICPYDQLIEWGTDTDILNRFHEASKNPTVDGCILEKRQEEKPIFYYWRAGKRAQGKNIQTILLNTEKTKYYSFDRPASYFDFLQSKMPIQVNELSSMKRGWFMGNFNPSVYNTPTVEVGILEHKAGEMWPAHLHKKADEINVLIEGSMRINNLEIKKNQIFVIPRGHLTKAVFHEDCKIVCVKVPSDTKDKYCY